MLPVVAVLTHPVFLPVWSLLLYFPLVAEYANEKMIIAAIWVGFVYLLLRYLYFKVIRKINLAKPNPAERRRIFKVYALVSGGFTIVNVFLIPEYMSFFVGLLLLNLILLFLAFVELKASWHTAVWSYLSCAGLMLLYNFQLANLPVAIVISLGILVVVFFTRFHQRAHSYFELLMGIAAGVLASIPILFF